MTVMQDASGGEPALGSSGYVGSGGASPAACGSSAWGAAAEVEAALRHAAETESRFRTLADCAPVLLWMAGEDGLCDFFNQGWLKFTGRTLEQELGNGWAEGVHPEDFARCMQTFLDAFVARRPFAMEYRMRRHDGEYRWIFDQGAPRFDSANRFVGFIGSCVDVTAQHEAHATLARLNQVLEERVRERTELATERATLLREVHHRVKNDLQLICSLLSIQEREIADERAARALEDCGQRVQAIAQIHEQMYQSRDLAHLSFSDHLRSLTARVERVGGNPRVEFTLDMSESVTLGVDRAIPCAMIVHELVINCFKHAFPGDRRGTVTVGCRREASHHDAGHHDAGHREASSRVRVWVADDGVGMPQLIAPSAAPSSSQREPAAEPLGSAQRGLGWALIDALCRQLRATLEITRSGGTRVALCFDDRLDGAAG
jgi:PAS domain S-box-containing protein